MMWTGLRGILIGMTTVTTIKVPLALRERISRDAGQRGVTASSLLTELLDNYERDQRLAAVGRAYSARPDVSYAQELAAWDETAADGLAE